jgi:hypothetical protein
MRASVEALARVKTRFRGIESDQRTQKWVSEVGIDIMLIAVDVNLHSYWSAHWEINKKKTHLASKGEGNSAKNIFITPRPGIDEEGRLRWEKGY